jgi:hypothetical protein
MFVGMTGYEAGITLNGKLTRRRTVNSKYGTSDIQWLRKCIDANATRYERKPKLKYLFRSITKPQNASKCYRKRFQKHAPLSSSLDCHG